MSQRCYCFLRAQVGARLQTEGALDWTALRAELGLGRDDGPLRLAAVVVDAAQRLAERALGLQFLVEPVEPERGARVLATDAAPNASTAWGTSENLDPRGIAGEDHVAAQNPNSNEASCDVAQPGGLPFVLLVLLVAATTGTGPEAGVPIGVGALALAFTLALAEASYRWVETPVRRFGFRGCARRLRAALRARAARRATALAGLATGAALSAATSPATMTPVGPTATSAGLSPPMASTPCASATISATVARTTLIVWSFSPAHPH